MSKRVGRILNTVFNILLIGILTFIYPKIFKPTDSVVFLDVGQGDAILIQNGSTQILIDGGNDMSVLYELGKYIPFYDRRIEFVVITHPHDDHILGLLYVMSRYEIGTLLYYPVCFKNTNYEMLISESQNLRIIKAGDTIRLGVIRIDVLWPREGDLEGSGCYKSWNGNINNDSVVLDFNYLGKNFLLMGDAEKEVEKVLVSDHILDARADVLKAGHHCSNSSSSETFLKSARPAIVVCSYGEGNKFGHPGSETLKTFSSLAVQYLSTARSGSIQIK